MPGLNDLLRAYGIAFSDGVWKGSFSLGTHAANIKSGTSIVEFPQGGILHFSQLQDEALSLLSGKHASKSVGVLGLYQTPGPDAGRIGVFVDSSCVDNKEDDMSCWCVVGILF